MEDIAVSKRSEGVPRVPIRLRCEATWLVHRYARVGCPSGYGVWNTWSDLKGRLPGFAAAWCYHAPSSE